MYDQYGFAIRFGLFLFVILHSATFPVDLLGMVMDLLEVGGDYYPLLVF